MTGSEEIQPEISSLDDLSDQAVRMYTRAATRPHFLPLELGADLGLTREATESAVAELLALRLFRPASAESGALSCVSPKTAALRLLIPLELKIHHEHSVVERIRARFQDLVPAFESGRSDRWRDEALETIADLDTVRLVIARAAHECTDEVLTSQPGGGRRADVLGEAAQRDEEMLGRGVRMRTIYQHAARYSAPTAAYIERMSRLGARVRTTGDGPLRMLVFDRRIAVMGVEGDPRAAIVVREPAVVAFLAAVFERSWLQAAPFPVSLDREEAKGVSSRVRGDIVKLLAEGYDDRAVAQRLGMSERTCRRHVAEIMRDIGAGSRFQAGYLLGRDRDAPPDRTSMRTERPAG